MFKTCFLWLADKIGGVVVGSGVTALGQAAYGFIVGNPDVAAILYGFAMVLALAVIGMIAWGVKNHYAKMQMYPKILRCRMGSPLRSRTR